MVFLLSFYIKGNDYVVDYSHDVHSVVGRFAANTEELADLVKDDYKLIDPEPDFVQIRFVGDYPVESKSEVMEKLKLRKVRFSCQNRSSKSLKELAIQQDLPRMY
jgi:hypothetical protein